MRVFGMKIFFTAIAAFIAVSLSAALSLPEMWDVKFFKVDEKIFLEGLDIGDPQQKIALSENVLNLDTAAQGADSAVLRCFITAEKAQTIWLGIGCKVFSLCLNGEMIYDFRQYGLGNDLENVDVRDHIVPLKLQVGENEIIINTRRTHWRLDFCYGKNRDIRWDIALKIIENYQPVRAELAQPEMALRPDRDSVMFTFVTTEAIPAGVDYRKKGDKIWLREYDTVGDLILREKSRIHRVKLSGIADWGDIEYRLVLLEPPAGEEGLRRPCRSPRTYKEVFSPVKTLHNPNKKEFSFVFFGDTQLSISKSFQTVAQRREVLKKLRSLPEYKKADFMVHAGDTDSYIHDIEKSLLSGMFDDFAPQGNEKLRPWLLVRGNHDSNGIAAENWYDYFQMPDEKSYYSIQLGEVFFIVLDCGEFFDADKFNAYNGPLLDMDKLISRQSRWLKKVYRSEAFRKAKFRVVIAHGEPQISRGRLNNTVRAMMSDILKDNSDEGRIHLWLAGHCHYYWRAARNSKTLVARAGLKTPPALPQAPVNWLTCDGPKSRGAKPELSFIFVSCSPEKLHIKSVDDNGKKFDEFSIDLKGELKTIYLDENLKAHPLPVR